MVVNLDFHLSLKLNEMLENILCNILCSIYSPKPGKSGLTLFRVTLKA